MAKYGEFDAVVTAKPSPEIEEQLGSLCRVYLVSSSLSACSSTTSAPKASLQLAVSTCSALLRQHHLRQLLLPLKYFKLALSSVYSPLCG
jgi:hypothetical protein